MVFRAIRGGFGSRTAFRGGRGGCGRRGGCRGCRCRGCRCRGGASRPCRPAPEPGALVGECYGAQEEQQGEGVQGFAFHNCSFICY